MPHIKGFTLLELMIVIILASIIAIYPLFTWQGSVISLDAETKKLADDIRYTQSLSMTKGERYRWVKTSATTYQIQNSAGTAILTPTGSTTTSLESGISFGSFTNLPNDLIAFDGQGVPYVDTASPGTALASSGTLLLNQGSDSESIVISPETGRVIVQ